MKKRACEKESVKEGTVVDRTGDISQEPAMLRLAELYEDMTQAEQDRAGEYLKQKTSQEEN